MRPNGYCQRVVNKKKWYVHRYAWTVERGEIPEGLTIDHLCKNRKCVNVLHMEVVTRGENALRGDSPLSLKARQTHCLRGHPLSGENLYMTPDGRRQCFFCASMRQIGNRILNKEVELSNV